MSLRLPAALYERIREYAESAYPEECCGALIGSVPDDFDLPERVVEVRELRPFANAWETAGKGTRYQIEPKELVKLELELLETGSGIVGWYHTHPDVPAWPSPFDLLRAWPFYSYLILSVVAERTEDARSWVRSHDGKDFLSENFEVF